MHFIGKLGGRHLYEVEFRVRLARAQQEGYAHYLGEKSERDW